MSKRSNELWERAKRANYVPPKMKFNQELPRDSEHLLLDPEKTALINIDIQNIFTEPGAMFAAPNAAQIVPKVNKLATYCRENGLPVIWVKITHRKDKSDMGSFGRLWSSHPIVTETLLAADSHWSQLFPELDLKPTDIIVDKPKYNAFWGSELEAVLRGLGVEWLVFTGIDTDVCVRNTLIDAFHRDFNVVLAMDATESIFPKPATFQSIEMLFGRVLTTEEIITELKSLKT